MEDYLGMIDRKDLNENKKKKDTTVEELKFETVENVETKKSQRMHRLREKV